MRVGRCGLLILGLAFAGSASSADSEDAYDNRCCWKGMPGEPDDNACSGDAFCAGPGYCDTLVGRCLNGGSFKPTLECQNCGCCPCCGEGSICCPPAADPLSGRGSFRGDVVGDPSPLYNKGSCHPVCENNCNGHGSCETNYPATCPPKSCVCDPPGFDPVGSCKTCRGAYFGANCTACPGVVSPAGGKGPAIACNGHGSCDGAGTTGGSGTCKCLADWKGEGCGTLFCPQGCLNGDCILDPHSAGTRSTCSCHKGWTGEDCSHPKCPFPEAPKVPGCIHGTCSIDTRRSHCDCDPGWGDKRCSTAICTQGCVTGQGECVAPNDCACAEG